MKYLLYILLTAVTFIACNNKPDETKEAGSIMVTIEPQRYFAEAIAGDKFSVKSMVPKGSSPETYDPTPQQLVDLANSKAYLRIGHIGFEQVWLDKITDGSPHMQIFDTSKGINLIYENEESHGDHIHGGVEPHVWNSPDNAFIIARNTLRALIALDKDNEDYYVARYDSLIHEIQQTDSVIQYTLAAGADSAFMIYHPALSYFAKEYGLHQLSIEEGGKEPSPAQLRKLIDQCKKEGIRVIFVQQEFDTRNAELIAKETNTRIIPINPLSYNWKEEMIKVANALKNE